VSNLLKILPVVNSKMCARWGFMALWLYGFIETSGRYFIVLEPQKNLNQNQMKITEKLKTTTILLSKLSENYLL